MTGFRNQFNELIKEQPAQEIKLNLLVNEVSGTLANFASKINLIERVISNGKGIKSPDTYTRECIPDQNILTYVPEIIITASELAHYYNMEPRQQADNVPYRIAVFERTCYFSGGRNIQRNFQQLLWGQGIDLVTQFVHRIA